jgi:hypothetical protein
MNIIFAFLVFFLLKLNGADFPKYTHTHTHTGKWLPGYPIFTQQQRHENI